MDVVFDNTVNGENFMMNVPFTVALVVFDPDLHLISDNNNVILGVNEAVMASEFVLYPNPAVTEFQIKKPNDLIVTSIVIYDVLGRTVLTPEPNTNVNIESLGSGLHFVKFETSRGILHRTLLKE